MSVMTSERGRWGKNVHKVARGVTVKTRLRKVLKTTRITPPALHPDAHLHAHTEARVHKYVCGHTPTHSRTKLH